MEFIPYSVLKNFSAHNIKTAFHLQNEMIHENGAIVIQEILESLMSKSFATDQTLLQWFLEHPYILQVEKSDTPGARNGG